MNNIEIVNHQKCFCCGSCAAVCPVNAITMNESQIGFSYPKVLATKCVSCGLCINACPSLNDAKKSDHIACYGVKNKNKHMQKASTSGGAFSLIADYFLEINGIIYGAVYETTNHIVSHKRLEGNYTSCMGTKYLQSSLDGVFLNVKEDLKNGKKVLFTGTPCQCAGLLAYLRAINQKTSNLFVVDLICHGTPSQKLFSDYIEYIEKKSGLKVVDHKFRTKRHRWNSHREENYFSNGTIDWISFDSQIYANIFRSGLSFKDSCYSCKYATKQRVGDITIGDFWGVLENKPDFYDIDGVSFVIINSPFGKEVFDIVKGNADVIDVELKDANQPNLHYPTPLPKNRSKFLKCYSKSFKYLVKKMFNKGRFKTFLSILRRKFVAKLKHEKI